MKKKQTNYYPYIQRKKTTEAFTCLGPDEEVSGARHGQVQGVLQLDGGLGVCFCVCVFVCVCV